ncbi:AAA family ATPase [Methanobrevibacter sp.]|uniref:AAA family ATPase n=1 Tax=Methanobrevibacter sp. TaxID=66852 RepID=UPI00388D6797
MSRKGLGKGLDSLIPDFYNEDFDSNSPQSLEDMLNDNEEVENETSGEDNSSENIFEQLKREQLEEEDSSTDDEEVLEDDQENNEDSETSEDLHSDTRSQEVVQTSQEIKIQEEHIAEVKEIVDKNPRITLWSSRSSAVFRYLRKTEPEFSISKEASILIDEAVSKKYPEIWALFDDY